MNKLIKEIVPNIRVSTDARDLLLNCCTGKVRESEEENSVIMSIAVHVNFQAGLKFHISNINSILARKTQKVEGQ